MDEIKVGDVVRVKDPDGFLSAFAAKIRDRDALVQSLLNDADGEPTGYCILLFQKRNGRGKEFRERMRIKWLVKHPAP